jgi:hypothetical protein
VAHQRGQVRLVSGVDIAALGERWRAFACVEHRGRLDDATPLDDADLAELANRRARWNRALAGQGWEPP